METVLTPPLPFTYDQSLLNITTGSLSDSWNKWSKGFKIYFEACELSKKTPAIQINILLHVVGEQCRELYEQLNVKCTTVEQVLAEFKKYFDQKKNLTVERHRFFTRSQAESETIEQYVFDLKKLSTSCEFGTLCDSLIKDRLICGIASKAIRERLLREADLTLEQAMEICRAAIVSKVYSEKIIESREKSVHNITTGDDSLQDNNVWQISQRGGYGRGRGRFAGSRGGRGAGRGAWSRRSAGGWRAQDSTVSARAAAGAGGSGAGDRGATYNAYNNSRCCNKCGTTHGNYACPAYGKRCLRCSRLNHFSRMCGVYQIEESDQQVIYCLNNEIDEWTIVLNVNSHNLGFKLDTGAEVNVLPLRYLSQVGLSKENLMVTTSRLHGYSGKNLDVLGKCFLKVVYKDNVYFLEFKVVDVPSAPVLGKNDCKLMNLVKRVFAVSETEQLHSPAFVTEYKDVFQGIGCLPGSYKIRVNRECKPVVHAPRKVPIPLREKLKAKLEDMERQGIIEKVEGPTDWVNSMTIVKKPNGDLRICLDPKELNQAIKREHFRLPTLDEIVSNLSGAQYFSTLDATNGFWQVKIENSDLCTFNTPFGRYKFLRMPYGISSACEVFHRKIYENFDDIEGVCMYVDDILVFAKTKSEHDERLRQVLERCRKINLKLNLTKCKFGLEEIKYLGHKITRKGLYPDDSHISAIINMPRPQNSKDVERLLGLTTYVGNFIPNLSNKTEPLRELLQKDIEWHWNERHENTWNVIKKCLSQKPVLQYYSMTKPIILSVDASKSGLGCVLLQDGLPVCYGSKALTKTEQRYAQIEKELYACVHACEKFYGYIYGRTDITIETDHKPLLSIIKKPIVDAPPRLQRMLLRLQPYSFKLVYKPGKQLHIADALSRAYEPLAAASSDHHDLQDELSEAVHTVCAYNELTDTHYLILQKETDIDSEMQLLRKYIRKGWPEEKKDVEDVVKPYWQYREDLTEGNGLLWKGSNTYPLRQNYFKIESYVAFYHFAKQS
ncbi:uncharacterized protein LOC134800377 [Cydia splendana]|uniref:uncharacterized protein LOC134800377 n=1 Tax=Cydia splendana TaxID=1100963 RepID=UPI00300CA9DC